MIKQLMASERMADAYDCINPIVRLAIRPTLKLVDARNHPLRGGASAALISLLTHYAVFEVIQQTLGAARGSHYVDPETKFAFTNYPIEIHILLTLSAIGNLGIGIKRHLRMRQNTNTQEL